MATHVDKYKILTEEEKSACEKTASILPSCPVCGKKAFLSHDYIDGYDFGYSVGCPSFCLDDRVHNCTENTPREDWFSFHGYFSKYTAMQAWVERVDRYGR